MTDVEIIEVFVAANNANDMDKIITFFSNGTAGDGETCHWRDDFNLRQCQSQIAVD